MHIHTIQILFSHLLADVSHLSGVPIRAPDDVNMDWILMEGPKLDKELLKYLEHGHEKPVFPEWLTPLSEKALSSDSATLIGFLRQILVFGYKTEYEPTDQQKKEAQASFESTEQDVEVWDSYYESSTDLWPLLATARRKICRITANISWQEIVPSHGPGAVYPSSLPSAKSCFDTIYPSIDRHYPFYEYFALPAVWQGDNERFRIDTCLSHKQHIECSLVAVPKDSRGPRLICVHPKEAIWVQQGQRRLLERAISRKLGKWINFRDQSVNGNMALLSSKTREYCTLDLKEASDRLSCRLIRSLFGDYTYELISAGRASHVKLFDGRVVELRKWAPMGNCLTFPVQSLVFYALVHAGIACHHGTVCDDIYVFGDDIIFPSRYYDGAVRALARCGLVPNLSKTFRHGFFRESCGVDAYKGEDVTPHRVKRIVLSSVTDLVAVCTLAKNMRMEGYEHTSAALYTHVRRAFPELPLGNNPEASGAYEYVARDLGYLFRNTKVRYNSNLQRWETKILQARARIDAYGSNHDWNHVLDSLIRLELFPDSSRASRPCADLWRDFSPDILPMHEESVYTVPHREWAAWGWTEVAI